MSLPTNEFIRASGVSVFFTGLPASGKSTIANSLWRKLKATGRTVFLLDGDAARKRFSADLGFSQADRNENIQRIARAAAGITAAGGIAICASIAPYDSARKTARHMISSHGRFYLVYVSTPLDVCEARDPKGHYAKARAGEIAHFTGVSDPYESPDDAEIIIDTRNTSSEAAADMIITRLSQDGI